TRGDAPDWGTVVLANDNAPEQTVVSGPTAAVERAERLLADAGLRAMRLPVACAFHSPVVAGAAGELAEALATAEVRAPGGRVWSNTTAAPYPDGPDEVRALLARQVAEPVRFVAMIEAMYAAGARVFVEAGPGRVLSGLVGKILADRPHWAVACDVAGENGVRRLLLALAELAAAGVEMDVAPLFAGRRIRPVDPAATPTAPGWFVDGAFVRGADGRPLPGGLRAGDQPPLAPPAFRVTPAGTDAPVPAVPGEGLTAASGASTAPRGAETGTTRTDTTRTMGTENGMAAGVGYGPDGHRAAGYGYEASPNGHGQAVSSVGLPSVGLPVAGGQPGSPTRTPLDEVVLGYQEFARQLLASQHELVMRYLDAAAPRAHHTPVTPAPNDWAPAARDAAGWAAPVPAAYHATAGGDRPAGPEAGL
ncbi:ACP S-malonyltransferase, partial [Frankia sp. CNm7]|uniref:acyltransferase domain-containing protein n=1 Tax=Frankia nepalensis TaxID=1836974 RepID=UPI001931BE52